MFWLLLVIAVTTGTFYYRWKRQKLYEIYSELPNGITSYPVIGHTYLLKNSDADSQVWFKRLGKAVIQHGGVSAFWIFNRLYVFVADPSTSEVILKSTGSMEKAYVTNLLRTVIGNGSIFAPVEIWRPRRKVLAPTFSMKNLNEFVKVFNEQSMIMTKTLNRMAGGDDFSVWNFFNSYAFDSVCKTTMGIELNSQNTPNHKFLISFDWITQHLAKRMVTPWLYPEVLYQRWSQYKDFVFHRKNIHDFIDEIIKIKRNELAGGLERNASGIKSDCPCTFLDMMIESSGRFGKTYSDLELLEETMVIVMAGTDTSAVNASFTAVMLSRYPDVQERVHQELDEIFCSSNRAITSEDLPNLKYLEAVIKESLRLYPPVPVTAREVTNDVELPSGITLVDGVSVVLDIWATHRNPVFWGDDAELFRPERFLEGPLKHPAQFQPFSLPMRNCLGFNYAMMSTKTMLANMLRRYRLLPPSNMDIGQLKEPLKVSFDIMMRHIDNYVIRLEEIK